MAESGKIRKMKYKRFKYSLDDLKQAIEAVQGPRRLSINKACQEYSIPKGTLVNRLHGRGSIDERKMGPQPVLSAEEENKLEKWILDKARFGFPMHENELKDAVQKVIVETQRPNPFTDNRPGKKWLELFLKRKPTISKRNAEIISKARASVTENEIRQWFEEVRQFLEENNSLDILQNPERIFNADETGVQLCPKTGKVLGPKQYRNFYDVAVGKEKESITVLANFSASGKVVPPMIVMPYKRIPQDITISLPDDYFIGRSDSGWMVGSTFYEYVADCFCPWLDQNNIKRPVLFFLDGHKSHISPELAELCIDKKIFIYCLLPNATHILQPCDVGIFRPLKVNWRKSVQHFKQKTSKTLTKRNFAPVFKEAFDATVKEETIKNAFKACGLFPFNTDNIDYEKCMSNRHKTENGTIEVKDNVNEGNEALEINEAKIFLNVLEQEMYTETLAKYKLIHEMNEESENAELTDELYKIWHKYYKKIDVKSAPNNKINILENIIIPPPTVNRVITPATIEIIGDITQEEIAERLKDITNISNFNVLSVNENIVNLDQGKEQERVKRNDNDDRKEEPRSPSTGYESTEVKITTQSLHLNEVWGKHLHYPKIEKGTKRIKAKVPLAIVSKKWKEYYEFKNKEKDEKEQVKQKRKEDRNLKKTQSVKDCNKAKRRYVKKRKQNNEKITNENINNNQKNSNKGKQVNKKHINNKEDTSDESSDDYTLRELKKSLQKSSKERKTNFDLSSSDLSENSSSEWEGVEKDILVSEKNNQGIYVTDFVMVEYEKLYYPGIVVRTSSNECEVRVMVKAANNTWKWPKQVDQIWYKNEEIVQKIKAPILTSEKERSYSVPEIEKYYISDNN